MYAELNETFLHWQCYSVERTSSIQINRTEETQMNNPKHLEEHKVERINLILLNWTDVNPTL